MKHLSFLSLFIVFTVFKLCAIAATLPELATYQNPNCLKNEWAIQLKKSDSQLIFGVKIPKGMLESIIGKTEPVNQKTNTDTKVDRARDFKLTNTDVPNQKLNISFKVDHKEWYYTTTVVDLVVYKWSWTAKNISVDITCDGSATLKL